MGWEKYFRTYFWTRKIPCTWTEVNSDLLAKPELYDMRWPLHEIGKEFHFRTYLWKKNNCFSLQKNLHETQVSLMCHVLWHESIWYIKVTGTIWRKILSIYKKNLSIRVAALLALSVILWISDLLLFPYWERFWWNQNQSLAGLKRYTTEIFLIPSGHFPCHIVELSDHVAKKEIAFFK